jgi:soluble lytic murein transglycosylase-like protein
VRIQPKGPAGISARIAEIEAKLDRVMGGEPAAVSSKGGGSQAFKLDPTTLLAGSIGTGSPSELKPLNPFGTAASVAVDRAPVALQPMIRDAAVAANVEPELLEALVSIESNFNPNTVSHAGAKGLAQLMPGTAAALGVKDPFDPVQNLGGGARYLGQMLREFNGDPKMALAAYNAGPGAVRRANGIPPFRETQDYVRKVLAKYEGIKQAG